MTLVSSEDLLPETIGRPQLCTELPLADGVLEALQHVLSGQA